MGKIVKTLKEAKIEAKKGHLNARIAKSCETVEQYQDRIAT